MDDVNGLKRDVFHRLMELAGRVFVHVRPAETVVLGRRGFVGAEKEQGIVLVLNPKMRYQWAGNVLEATLSFNRAPERCLIPADDILSVFSPDLNVQFISTQAETPASATAAEDAPDAIEDAARGEQGKVIQVDFSKRSHQ